MELIVLSNGHEARVELEHLGSGIEVKIEDRKYLVDTVATNGSVRSLIIEGRQFEVAVRSREEGRYQISHRGSIEEVEVLDPLTHLARQGSDSRSQEGLGRVTAYMPGRVVELLVQEGDEVTVGQGLVVLEAMKMENEIQAERAGVVKKVFVVAGQPVEGGDPLFELG
ncbi:MAG: biotin/lipoyl-containing protein [Thermoanaerobaculia bacterium]